MFPQTPALLPPSIAAMYAQHFCVNTWLSVSLPATVQDTGQGLTMTPPPSAVPSAVVICLMSRWKTKPRMNCWDPAASEGGAGTGTQVCLTLHMSVHSLSLFIPDMANLVKMGHKSFTLLSF